jgi:cobalt-zinc-cadmium efflux system outer membrane protein
MTLNRLAAGRLAAGLASVLLAGCAAQHYVPAPLAADAAASAFSARSLADPGLRSFEERCLGGSIEAWPTPTWDLKTLSLAAWYFNPQLDEARASLSESQAALKTAGARPNPTLSASPGVPSPYLLTLDLSFPLETAGKRGLRIEGARNLELASRLELAETAWKIRSAVREALLDYLVSVQSLDRLRSEAEIRETQVKILQQMFSAGESRRLEVDAARSELSRAHSALRAAEEASAEQTAKLAAAIGVPAGALRGAHLVWPDLAAPPRAESFPLAEMQRDAVLNRLDVRDSLARYAAAEAALQLEIAKQYPDVDLGPGYTYEELRSYFTVGLSAAIPLFDRNQGPIAEAEARRRQASAQFVETQSQAISRSERALAIYRVALEGLTEAGQLASLEERRLEATRQSVRAGEQDSLDLADAEIQYSIAAGARLDAVAHAQRALGELEEAVERPLAPGDELPAVKDLDAPR